MQVNASMSLSRNKSTFGAQSVRKSRMTKSALYVAATLILATVSTDAAHATLGASRASVEADRTHMAARLSTSIAATYKIDTITLANGGVTKEFSRSDGLVFAVTWAGPSRPDLRQLLGARFDDFQADNAQRDRRRTRTPLVSERADLVVHSAGRSGGFWGFAFIPQLLPPGFSASDLRQD
jgi:hypothetical protein